MSVKLLERVIEFFDDDCLGSDKRMTSLFTFCLQTIFCFLSVLVPGIRGQVGLVEIFWRIIFLDKFAAIGVVVQRVISTIFLLHYPRSHYLLARHVILH